MQMMYETIYKALVEVGLEDAYSPQDYLNFYCLGNREALDGGQSSETPAAANNPQVHSYKNYILYLTKHPLNWCNLQGRQAFMGLLLIRLNKPQ